MNRQLHTVIRQMPGPRWIDPLKIRLIGLEDPIAKDVLAVDLRATGRGIFSPVRWPGRRLGNVSIEGAYFYPVPATAA